MAKPDGQHDKNFALAFFVTALILFSIVSALTAIGAAVQSSFLIVVGGFVSLGFGFYYLRR